MFGTSKTISLDIRDEVVELVSQEYDQADNTSDANGEEGQSSFSEVEAVHGRINQGENLKERIVNSICERSVDVGKSDCRILDKDFDRLDKGIPEDFGKLQICLVDFGLGLEVGSSSNLAQSLSTATKDVLRRSFGEADDKDDHDWTCKPEDFPEAPSPATCC